MAERLNNSPPGTSVDRPSIPIKDEITRDGWNPDGHTRLDQMSEITRDTYGFPDAPPTPLTRDERIDRGKPRSGGRRLAGRRTA